VRHVLYTSTPSAGDNGHADRGRGRVLVVDTDPLARWSLSMYLSRWFVVDATASLEDAERLLQRGDTRALVVSGDLPGSDIDRVEELARRCSPGVVTVRTDTGVVGIKRPSVGCVRIEKPYRLTDLARLLGVSEVELTKRDADGTPTAPPGAT
jgi:DNA-binding NtrC family response regulator